MKRSILIIASICVSTSVFAGGYRVALQGQKTLAMGHAGVAMTESSEVVFFNPAGMVFLENDMDISGGITLIDGVTKYQNQTANAAAETDNPIGAPISFYLSKRYNQNVSYGIGVYTAYGNTVEWPTDWAGSHMVNNIELKTIYIQPTISYKFNDKYSIGFGPTYVIGKVEFNRNLSTSLVDANGNRSNVNIEASGIDAWGYNIGFLAKPNDKISFGISYRSKVDLEARGENADFENIPASLQSTFPDTTFNADLVLPAELTIGIAYNISADTVFAIDINRTYWSAYKNLDIEFNNGAGISLNPRNYQDVNIYRFGLQHKTNEKLTVRGGIYFDDSPIQDGFFTPETPRNDSIGYTAGASYKLTERLDLDFSFLYLRFKEFEGSYDHINQSGTLISFGGDYKSVVTAVGFGLNYKY
jgi:long-chain fatty acid transport protein